MLNLELAADGVQRMPDDAPPVAWTDGWGIVTQDRNGFGIGYGCGDGVRCHLPILRWESFETAQALALALADWMLLPK